MRDLIIIGGGAAGLSAAMYALGKQLDFLIIYETFGKAGTAQHLGGQAEEEYLAGSEAVRLFERSPQGFGRQRLELKHHGEPPRIILNNLATGS